MISDREQAQADQAHEDAIEQAVADGRMWIANPHMTVSSPEWRKTMELVLFRLGDLEAHIVDEYYK